MAGKQRVSVDKQENFAQYIAFSGVQSAANAFLAITIPTNVTPSGGYVLELEEVQFNIDVGSSANSFSMDIQAALSRQTKAAMPALTDLDLLARSTYFGLGGGTFTAGAVSALEMPVVLQLTGKQIIAAPNVYFLFDTGGFGTAMTISGRIYYKQVNMTKDRILEVLYG